VVLSLYRLLCSACVRNVAERAGATCKFCPPWEVIFATLMLVSVVARGFHLQSCSCVLLISSHYHTDHAQLEEIYSFGLAILRRGLKYFGFPHWKIVGFKRMLQDFNLFSTIVSLKQVSSTLVGSSRSARCCF